MTPIKPVSKTTTINFGNESINEFWLETPAAIASSSSQDQNYLERAKGFLDSAPENSVICVFSEGLSSRQLCESIAKARDNGSRVYILTNACHNEMKNLDGCLIRYEGSKRIGSFILINPNSNGVSPTGCIFNGLFSDGSMNRSDNLLLDLDSEQIKTLYRYFCYQFWNKAEKERIGNKERKTDSAPLDIFPPVEDSCDFEYLKSTWNKDTENALITTSLLNGNSYLDFSNVSNSAIMSILPGIDSGIVRSLKQKANEIHACNDTALINSIKISDDTWLVPKTDASREEEVYSIRLNAGQKGVLDKHIISTVQEKTLYRYVERETRGNLSGKVILPLGASVSEKYEIKAESKITIPTEMQQEILPREEFGNQRPELADDGKSVSITYNWTNIPFTLPSGSKEHPLYKNWDEIEKNISKFIESINTKISETKTGGNPFEKLKGFFLGVQQKFKEYESALKLLQNIEYRAIEKTALYEKIGDINSTRNFVEKLSNENKEEQRKAGLEKQIDAEKEKERENDTNLKNKKAALEAVKKEIENLSNSQRKLEAESEKKRKEVKSEKEELKKTAEIKVVETSLKDKNVEKRRLDDEVSKLNAQKGNILNNISRLNDQLKKPAKEPQKQGSVLSNLEGGKSQSKQEARDALAVPELPHIPRIGKLYQHNGKDYLAITNWEDYPDGEKEAKRLNAKLCAKGDNNG